jgi:tripartite-type tricarboxylate transporter receptor subunit TctC
MSEVLADAKLVERLGDLGFVTKAMTSAEFTAFVANQVQTFQAPVKASGAKL